ISPSFHYAISRRFASSSWQTTAGVRARSPCHRSGTTRPTSMETAYLTRVWPSTLPPWDKLHSRNRWGTMRTLTGDCPDFLAAVETLFGPLEPGVIVRREVGTDGAPSRPVISTVPRNCNTSVVNTASLHLSLSQS